MIRELIRSPLAHMKLISRQVLKLFSESDRGVSRSVRDALLSIWHYILRIRALADQLSLERQGTIPVNRLSFSLDESLRNMVSVLKHFNREKLVKIELRREVFTSTMDDKFVGDCERIQLVFSNVLQLSIDQARPRSKVSIQY